MRNHRRLNESRIQRRRFINEKNLRKNDLYDILEEMKDMLGADHLLDALAQAMSDRELQENLEYIDRMEDLGLFE